MEIGIGWSSHSPPNGGHSVHHPSPFEVMRDAAGDAAIHFTSNGPRLLAVDFGNAFWVNETGQPEDSYSPVQPGAKSGTRRIPDFIGIARWAFAHGGDVVTEASTPRSFRGGATDLVGLLTQHPERRLFTVSPRQARNEYFRWAGHPYNGHLQDEVAAAMIWRVATTQPTKRWRPRDEALAVRTEDPLRPHLRELIRLREDGYPLAAMSREVYGFFPNAGLLDAAQKRIFVSDNAWVPNRCAAFIISLKEPTSGSRGGWERVIGASAHARGNLYRQILLVGKPHNDTYVHKQHYSGIPMRDAHYALRRLRSTVLRDRANELRQKGEEP